MSYTPVAPFVANGPRQILPKPSNNPTSPAAANGATSLVRNENGPTPPKPIVPNQIPDQNGAPALRAPPFPMPQLYFGPAPQQSAMNPQNMLFNMNMMPALYSMPANSMGAGQMVFTMGPPPQGTVNLLGSINSGFSNPVGQAKDGPGNMTMAINHYPTQSYTQPVPFSGQFMNNMVSNPVRTVPDMSAARPAANFGAPNNNANSIMQSNVNSMSGSSSYPSHVAYPYHNGPSNLQSYFHNRNIANGTGSSSSSAPATPDSPVLSNLLNSSTTSNRTAPIGSSPASAPKKKASPKMRLIKHFIGDKLICEVPEGKVTAEELEEAYKIFSSGGASSDFPGENGVNTGGASLVCRICRKPSDDLTLFSNDGAFCSKKCMDDAGGGTGYLSELVAKQTKPLRISNENSNGRRLPYQPESEQGPRERKRIVKMRVRGNSSPRRTPRPIDDTDAAATDGSIARSPSPKKKFRNNPLEELMPERILTPDTAASSLPDSSVPAPLPQDVATAAPLIALIRRSPDIEKWKVEDVATLLGAVRGLDGHVALFTEHEVDGSALKFLMESDDNPMTKNPMNMPKWAVFKLKSVITLLNSKDSFENLCYVL